MTIEKLNKIILAGQAEDLIRKEEVRHSSAYAVVASKIATKGARVVLISGPSSSGKTTSSMRIGVELSKIGLPSLQISLDNYFVRRELTPLDADGNYDFEALEAIDIAKFGQEMLALVAGESVNLQKFDFKSGCPGSEGRSVTIDSDTILIVEGLHALNPKLTTKIASRDKFEIYLSALSPLQLNPTSEIRPRDNVLMRRIVRDYKYRGRSALATIESWSAVRRGEQLHILPFEDEADLIIDTSLSYEIAVLKPYVVPLLVAARDLLDAKRLLSTLETIEPIDDHLVPSNSVIREYIGGSCFEY